MSNYISITCQDLIIHQWPNFNGDLDNLPKNLRCRGVFTSHRFISIWSFILALNSMLVKRRRLRHQASTVSLSHRAVQSITCVIDFYLLYEVHIEYMRCHGASVVYRLPILPFYVSPKTWMDRLLWHTPLVSETCKELFICDIWECFNYNEKWLPYINLSVHKLWTQLAWKWLQRYKYNFHLRLRQVFFLARYASKWIRISKGSLNVHMIPYKRSC